MSSLELWLLVSVLAGTPAGRPNERLVAAFMTEGACFDYAQVAVDLGVGPNDFYCRKFRVRK